MSRDSLDPDWPMSLLPINLQKSWQPCLWTTTDAIWSHKPCSIDPNNPGPHNTFIQPRETPHPQILILTPQQKILWLSVLVMYKLIFFRFSLYFLPHTMDNLVLEGSLYRYGLGKLTLEKMSKVKGYFSKIFGWKHDEKSKLSKKIIIHSQMQIKIYISVYGLKMQQSAGNDFRKIF